MGIVGGSDLIKVMEQLGKSGILSYLFLCEYIDFYENEFSMVKLLNVCHKLLLYQLDTIKYRRYSLTWQM